MDVEMRSPPMRFRTASNKRGRSPDSPSPTERVSKRALIVAQEAEAHHAWPTAINLPKRRSIHEDEWLDQTRGLTIHSPALSSSAGEVDQIENEANDLQRFSSHGDIQMNSQEYDNGSHPSLRLHDDAISRASSLLASIPVDDIDAGQHSPSFREQQIPALHDDCSYATSAPLILPPPHITLHPATPATPSSGVRASSIPLVSSSPMALESVPPTPSSWKTSSSKKRSTIGMGPRADCEKCRLKVPGHWMHFD